MKCRECPHFDWSCDSCDHDSAGYCDMDLAEFIMKFFPDQPCNYNGMDELADCDFCSQNCGKVDARECWLNAIRNKWYEKM